MCAVRALPSYFNELPNFSKTYENTPENVKHVAHEVAELFGMFLTQEAHEGALYQELRGRGVILLSGLGRYLSNEQIDLFVEKLASKIEAYLTSDRRRSFRLSVDWAPEEKLYEILQEVDLDRVASSSFSSKSCVWVDFDINEIRIDAHFKGRSF